MPLFHDMRCTACGRESPLLSDGLALQLDDGSLRHLPHPGEERACRESGLTLQQASERGRLFDREFLVCRRCGGRSETIVRKLSWRRALDDPRPWAMVLPTVAVAAIGAPVALWLGRDAWAFAFVGMASCSPLIDMNERRKARRKRAARGEPDYPTADAPGRVPVAKPAPPPPCCDQPDLLPVAALSKEKPIPCRACGRGALEIVGTGIA